MESATSNNLVSSSESNQFLGEIRKRKIEENKKKMKMYQSSKSKNLNEYTDENNKSNLNPLDT